MSLAGTSVTLLRFPRDDGDFEACLGRVADALGSLEYLDPATFQEHLRGTYPNAVVHPRDSLGGLEMGGPVWYVYRDGSAVPG